MDFSSTIDCQNDRFVNDAAICQAVAQMLTRVGIATTPEVMPHAVWVPRANKHEFSLFTYFWTFDTPEPSIMLISQFATPDPSAVAARSTAAVYSNPEFDAALDQALITLDRGARESFADQGDRHRLSRLCAGAAAPPVQHRGDDAARSTTRRASTGTSAPPILLPQKGD